MRKPLSLAGAATLGCLLTLSPLSPLIAAEVVLNAGTDEELLKSLREASLSVRAVDVEKTTNSQELIAAAQADYERMVAALYDKGYFGPTVSIKVDGKQASDVSVLARNVTVNKIVIDVTPGPLFTFSEAEIAPLPEGIAPPEGFVPGATARTSVMRTAATAGVRDWRSAGHALAELDSQKITANHRTDNVSAVFRVTPGPRLTFGVPRLGEGSLESDVRPERIIAIAGIPQEKVFDPAEVRRAADRLRRAGAFSSATVVEDDHASAGDTLGTTINVTDAKKRRLGAGAEISSTDGLTLTGYWIHRNLFGGSERLRFDGEIAGIGKAVDGGADGVDYTLSTTLTYPAFAHPDMDLVFGIEATREDEPAYRTDAVEGTVGLDRYITPDLTGTLELGLRYNYSVDDLGEREFFHATFSGGLTWDKRNDEFNATKGFYTKLTLSPFVGLNESDSTGLRSEADLRAYLPLGTERFVYANRLQLGSVVGPSIIDTPSDWLYYSGGGGSVRGQGYKSLGVTENGVTTGGRSYAAISTELRSKLTDTIGAVAFVDYGFVSGAENFTGGEWQGGAGLGMRYFTPIGPVRLDVAVPVTGDDDSFAVYIGIGQAF
ncbi:autotransporter assembly complex family protein [Pseudooceanicola sp. HF7]|uniref:autotransporter assembly complex protein TamA n=1 Tax=Pseudooceanicola sp. HF7 TaxID=2721560 RepID=UPI001430BB14|nr:BamA/TamA family outer membrane protein [Pseudooceanicola sp. HF7]NIZ07845.1 BamA/TamA family outer membrane protein [Pseudooceanicola sp. HF7]